jgi:hypothetical protein
MKRGLLKSLENLESEIVPEESEVIDDATLLAIMEESKELDEQMDDIKETKDTIDEVEASIERLEALRDVIRKHGISAPIMEAADPYGELSCIGVCQAYENLNTYGLKNSDAEKAIEGIGDLVKAALGKLTGLFKALGNKFKDFAIGFRKLFGIYHGALLKIERQLDIITIDPATFGEISVKALTFDNFSGTMTAIEKIKESFDPVKLTEIIEICSKHAKQKSIGYEDPGDIEKARKAISDIIVPLRGDESLKKYLGIIVSEAGSHTQFNKTNTSVGDNRGTISELGWVDKDIKHAVSSARTLHTDDTLENFYLKMQDICYELAIMNGDYIDYVSDVDVSKNDDGRIDVNVEKQRKIIYKDTILLMYNLSEIICLVSDAVYKVTSNICSSALQVGNAAIKAKQK